MTGRNALAGLAALVIALALAALVVLTGAGAGLIGGVRSSPTPPPAGTVPSGVASGPAPSQIGSSPPTAVPASGAPSPGPNPVAQLVPAPLTGRLVTPAAAARHVTAVMVDDHIGARPQSGFDAASIVWQAPAEGGIPRYMLLFQDQVPGNVGPVRSSRQYFIEWASEWRAMYVHAGGSPQALATLAARGRGQWVWNADAFTWEGTYLVRVTGVRVLGGAFFPLVAPHNLYTDGERLDRMAGAIGVSGGTPTAVWHFGADAPREDRPAGTRLTVVYPYEAITYRYDPAINAYRRLITSGGPYKPQLDAATGTAVAPKNVVILKMAFGPLDDGHPDKHRLEAADVGHGRAWISTNGITVAGTWRKASPTAPTLLYGPDGEPVTLTAGQTFVQVLPLEASVSLAAGRLPAPMPPPLVLDGLAAR